MNNIVYHYSFQDNLYKWQILLPIEKHENTCFKYLYLIENQISNKFVISQKKKKKTREVTYLITLIISVLKRFECCRLL